MAGEGNHNDGYESWRRLAPGCPSGALQLPDTLAAATQVPVSADEEIWVQRPGFPSSSPRTWDVFSPGGHYLGPVTTPAGLYMVTDIGRDYVLGVNLGDDSVQSVVTYSLVKGGE